MALAIKLSSFISGGFTGDLMRWILKEDVSGATIDTHEEPGPHGVVYNFAFTYGIRDIIYRIELYDVPPGGTVGNLIKSHVLSVTTNTLVIDADIEIIVGRGTDVDPDDLDTETPEIPALVGKEISFYKRGVGQLLQFREPEISFDDTTGKISLLNGDEFNLDDVYIIKVSPQIIVNPAGSVGSLYKDIVVETVERNLVPADAGKKIIIDGTQKVLTFGFPEISTYPEKIPLFIENMAEDNENINIVFKMLTPGEEFYFNGQHNADFIMSRGDKAEIIKVGVKVFAFSDSYFIKNRGKVELLYQQALNTIIADGTEYEQDDLPGLMKFVNSLNPAQVKDSYAEWNLTSVVDGTTYYYNRGFYAKYGTKVRVPNLLGMSLRALLNMDGAGADIRRYTNYGGGLQRDSNRSHGHRVNTGGTGSGANPGKSLIRQSYNGDGYGAQGTGTGTGGPYIEVSGESEANPINIGLVPTIIV